jgi:hypothetical protein
VTVPLGNPFSLGATNVATPVRTDRLALGASFRPSTTPSAAASGFLAGPAGTQGELTLVSDVLLRVAPFVAVIQGTHNSAQGQYIVPNTQQRDLAVPAKDATLFRKALIVVRVADSLEAGVASSPTTDGAWLEIVPGALAASNPALPSTPANAVVAGELTVPSAASGQPVTITKYDPRTTMRGSVLPVIADGANRPGHDGEAPSHDGQYRDHPSRGLERGRGGAWTEPVVKPRCTVYRLSAYGAAGSPTVNYIPWEGQVPRSTAGMWSASTPTRIIIPETGEYDISTYAPWAGNTAAGGRSHGIRRNGDNAQIIYLGGANQPAGSGWFGWEQSGRFVGYELTAGDYLEMLVIQNAVPTLNIANTARMTVELARR